MLSRLSLSEEKEKLFLNWTEPFPELSFCPVRLKLVFFRCFGLRILVWDLALVCLLLMLFGFFPRSLFYLGLPGSETLKAVFKIETKTDLPIKCLCSLLPLSLHLLQAIHVEASSYRRRFWAARQVPGWLRDPTLIVWRILEEEPIYNTNVLCHQLFGGVVELALSHCQAFHQPPAEWRPQSCSNPKRLALCSAQPGAPGQLWNFELTLA